MAGDGAAGSGRDAVRQDLALASCHPLANRACTHVERSYLPECDDAMLPGRQLGKGSVPTGLVLFRPPCCRNRTNPRHRGDLREPGRYRSTRAAHNKRPAPLHQSTPKRAK